MNNKGIIAGTILLTVTGAGLTMLSYTADAANSAATESSSPPEPTLMSVANRKPVVVDHGAMMLYVDKIKDMYDVNYFKLIKQNREAQLNADWAKSMASLRQSGYRMKPDGTVEEISRDDLMGDMQLNSRPADPAMEPLDPKVLQARQERLSAEENKDRELIDGVKLVMLTNDVVGLRMGNQIIEAKEGDTINGLKIAKVDVTNGNVTVKNMKRGYSRTVFIQTMPHINSISYFKADKDTSSESDND